MYETMLDLLASMVISPLLFCYVCLLSDRWRVPRSVLFALALSSAFVSQSIALFAPVPVFIKIVLLESYNVGALALCSKKRDVRFLFVICTALLFALMNTTICSIFAYPLGIHRLYLRLLLDAALLGLGARFFRPVFLDILHTVADGWKFLTLFPLALSTLFCVLLTAPGYSARCFQTNTRLLCLTFAALAVVGYVIFFRFFRVLLSQNAEELNHQLLQMQFTALAQQAQRRQKSEDELRMLRHDMRHYLRMLSTCLEADDYDGAQQVLCSIEQLQSRLQELGTPPAAEGRS